MATVLKAFVVALLALACSAPLAQGQTTTPLGFQVEPSVGAYPEKIAGMAYAPGGRVFTVSKQGRVYAARTDGTLAPKLLYDLRTRVNSASDRGLLGVAADKSFATNGYLYLLYTYELNPLRPDVVDPTEPSVSRLVRVTVNPDDTLANPADPETVILGSYASGPCPAPDNDVDCIPADFYWHTIGSVRVDPVDGTLWLGSGDASSGATQQQAFRTYDERSFAGKIIHVDTLGRGLPGHAFCPEETDLDKVCTKLHAKGFRNPFRFTLRSNKNPVVGDVGYSTQEEVDIPEKGGNYGWPCYEGSGRTPGYQNEPRCIEEYKKEGTSEAHKKPLWSYPRGAGASVLGGPQLTGSAYPEEYRGDIFVGDYVQGWVKRLQVTEDDTLTGVQVEDFASGMPAFTDLQQDPSGRVAFMNYGFGTPSAVQHFAYSGNLRPTARASATPTSGVPPLTVQFTGSTSSDPESGALTYDWDFGDGSAHATTPDPSHAYTTAGDYTAVLTVTDPAGNAHSATVPIKVGAVNAEPSATITAPAATATYRAGQTIAMRATASDAEDGTLPDSAYAWDVVVRHNTHLHEHLTATGPSASFVTGNDHDADSHYEIRLTVTDSGGATTSRTTILRPATVRFTLNSSPPGAPVVYSGHPGQATPLSVEAAVGFRASISAAETFVSEGRTYRFKGWSDRGARAHNVTVPARATALLAIYEPVGLQQLTFVPTADTWVNSTAPNTAYGTSGNMTAVGGRLVRQSLLRFAVSGIAGGRVVRARLVTYASNGSAESGGQVFPTTTSAWSESTTYATRPALATGSVGGFGPTRADEWFETTLTDGAVTQDEVVSLAISSQRRDDASYRTRQATAGKPLLILEVAPPTETLTFRPSADTEVWESAPDTNYGGSSVLDVDGGPAVKTAYLRFPVSGLAGRDVLSTKLRMYQREESDQGGKVSKLSSSTWTESGTTWNTRPAVDGPEVGAFGPVPARGLWYETPLATGAVTGDGDHSFALTSDSTDGSYWGSRTSAQPPELIVTVDDR